MHSPASDCLGRESSDSSSPSALDQPERLSEFVFIHEEFPERRCSTPLPLGALFRTTSDTNFKP